jgi:recombination protein RecT
MKTNEAKPEAKPTNLAVTEKTVADSVLARVAEFTKAGVLKMPENYSAGNALKFAWLILSQAKDKDGNPVLNVATKESVANALLEMVIQGLNPMKKQCYFIAYGKALTMMRSYQGSIAVAKRVAPVKSVKANVVYKKDVFEYAVDSNSGVKVVTKHEQLMENIDINEIRGAYAVVNYTDGSSELEIMNILQIKKAWAQGSGGGNTKAHQNFTDEMCLKTVINRACKKVINNSDDSALFTDEDKHDLPTDTVEATVVSEIKESANLTEIGLEEMATPAVETTDNQQENNSEAAVKEEPNY